MAHNHDDHSGHNHSHGAGHVHGGGDAKSLGFAAAITGGFMLAEVAGGIISGSLALLADAGHMLTDFAALTMAFFALRFALRPADAKRSYGFDRLAVLAAFVNGIALFAIAIWITIEAIERWREPVEILGGLMFWIALAGLAVNALSFWILTRGESNTLNVRAAALHVMGDMLGSVAALVASIIIMWTGWVKIDPILSVLVSVIILRAAWTIVRESGRILLEAAPSGFDQPAAKAALEKVSGVADIHHMHVWSINEARPMATLHARLTEGSDAETVKRDLKAVLENEFNISHATVEIEAPGADCADEGAPDGHGAEGDHSGHSHGEDGDHAGHDHDEEEERPARPGELPAT
ncbi:cation diffusion facilitator family transporter [Paracoccaceae bacterium GXU_MW_L88]